MAIRNQERKVVVRPTVMAKTVEVPAMPPFANEAGKEEDEGRKNRTLRMSDSEWAELDRRAAKMRLDRAAYVRYKCLRGRDP